jgi:hypothetical protein
MGMVCVIYRSALKLLERCIARTMPARAFATLVPIILLETSFGNTAGSRSLGLVRAEIGFRMDFPTTLSVDLFCHSLSRGYAITQNFVSLLQMKQRATKNPRQVPSRGRRFLPCGRQKNRASSCRLLRALFGCPLTRRDGQSSISLSAQREVARNVPALTLV